MNPEEKELLRDTAELVKENNKILHSMRRSARFSSFLRLVYWVLIIGSAVGTYYFLEPYINAATNAYNDMKQNIESVKGVTSKIPALPSWMTPKQ